MASPAEIVNRAAKRLGKLGSGQTLASNLKADLDQSYTEVYARLAVRNLTTWDETEDVPDEYAEPVVNLVAEKRITDFSVPPARAIEIASFAANAIPEIKELQASNVYKTPEVDYF